MNDFGRLLIEFFRSDQAAEVIDLIADQVIKILAAERGA